MKTKKAIELAKQKGVALSSDLLNGKRIYKYSNDGYNWTIFNGNLTGLISFLSN